MNHIRETIQQLRRYIAEHEKHDELEEVDVMLCLALEELRRKIAEGKLAKRG